jgi:hypothetical protein
MKLNQLLPSTKLLVGAALAAGTGLASALIVLFDALEKSFYQIYCVHFLDFYVRIALLQSQNYSPRSAAVKTTVCGER